VTTAAYPVAGGTQNPSGISTLRARSRWVRITPGIALPRADLCSGTVALPLAALEASAHWSHQLAAWAIPEAIITAAPESPWGFPPQLFALSTQRALTDTEFTPSRRRAAEAIPIGGSVLDVGAGGGAASLPLAPPAGELVAVDESRAMLDVFAEGAERRDVLHTEILGRWPDVAPETAQAPVVVCHHVVYNVGDLAPFLAAIDDHAQLRVVVELTDRHPQSDLSPLWRTIHGIDRPSGPSATDAAEVAVALGYDVNVERFDRPSLWQEWPRDERIAFARRRLCVGPEHDSEIRDYLDETAGQNRNLVTLWWDSAS
jgi:SAM-dependent methyltransferase